jgi:hypothetical protein
MVISFFMPIPCFGAFVLIVNCKCRIYSCAADMLRNCDSFVYEQQKRGFIVSFNPKCNQ